MNKLRTKLREFSFPASRQNEMSIDEHLLYYVKKVSGKEDSIYNYKFYDEREWRYIPPIDNNIHLEIVDKNCSRDNLNSLSEKTKEKKIVLSAKDINYIIVSKDSEIKDIIKFFKNNDLFLKDIDRICTRIITVEQIKNDF